MKAIYEKPRKDIAYKKKKRQNSFSPQLEKSKIKPKDIQNGQF